MDYQELPLKEEIRRCLHAHVHPVHPKNIRLWIESDREDRSLASDFPAQPKAIQSLDHIKRIMRYMDDVEVVSISGKYYRRIKQKGLLEKLTRVKQWLCHKKNQLSLMIKGIKKKVAEFNVAFLNIKILKPHICKYTKATKIRLQTLLHHQRQWLHSRFCRNVLGLILTSIRSDILARITYMAKRFNYELLEGFIRRRHSF